MTETRGRVVSIVVALLLLSTAAFAETKLALAPGDSVPLMRGRSWDQHFTITDYPAHRLTLINFWAPWCVPCKAEMPALQKLHEVYAEDGLDIIGVLHDNATAEEVGEFAESLGITYPLILPHTRATKRWGGLAVLPTSFLVDQNGTLLRKYVGATAEQIVGLIYDVEAAMAGKALGPVIIPETPSFATDEDRMESKRREAGR
jgi:thiol-disulfide isomerase/thioredoxin